MDILQTRLINQKLSTTSLENPADVVSWFGAVQSQDFAAAKWALALRSKKQTAESIEQAFNRGEILRTHVMRPTWHFVAPKDIRWLLALTAPRVQKYNGHYYRKSGLDKTIFQKSNDILTKALRGGRQLTRTQLNEKLIAAKIPTDRLGLSYTLIQAELDGLICSGPRRNKQFTYMLLEERVQKAKPKTHDEALAEITKRYFQSHGPATIQDFVWWSGLTTTDAKLGIAMLGSKLTKITEHEQEYWFVESTQNAPKETIRFLSSFDEYIVAYTNRAALFDAAHFAKLDARGNVLFQYTIILDGKVIGVWKRIVKNKSVDITITLFEKASDTLHEALKRAASEYAAFLQLPMTLEIK